MLQLCKLLKIIDYPFTVLINIYLKCLMIFQLRINFKLKIISHLLKLTCSEGVLEKKLKLKAFVKQKLSVYSF